MASTVLMVLLLLCMPLWAGETEWKHAVGERAWSFPGDHGNHEGYRTEWWYFTGNLSDKEGSKYGYELTFFRQGLSLKSENSNNPWSVQDIYLAHFALTDVTSRKHWFAERTSRRGPGFALSKAGSMDVRVTNWSARMVNGTINLSARYREMEMELVLAPRKPPVLHGQKGLSRKGPNEGQASYYYSFTDLETRGTIKIPSRSQGLKVSGTSWFDHEFGSNQLSAGQSGWDWFGLHLSDGRDLMVYFLRKKDGSIEATSSGTLVDKRGASRHLALLDLRVEILDTWKSPNTGGKYPSRWRLVIPSAKIDVTIGSLVPDQELLTTSSTGVTYWEGAVEGKGESAGEAVSVKGYVELTGYAGSMGGVF